MEGSSGIVIGAGLRVKGKVRGGEDLVLKGRVEGTITLAEHHLTVEPEAQVVGTVEVKGATVGGSFAGNASATDLVTLSASAKVLGDVQTQRLVVEDGAKFRGRIEMDVELPDDLGMEIPR